MKYVSIALSTIKCILALYQNVVNTLLHPELMANRFFRNQYFYIIVYCKYGIYWRPRSFYAFDTVNNPEW